MACMGRAGEGDGPGWGDLEGLPGRVAISAEGKDRRWRKEVLPAESQ